MFLEQTDSTEIDKSQKLLEELKNLRKGNIAPFQEKIANDPDLLKAFLEQYKNAYANDFTIPRKYVELIMMALGVSRGVQTTINAHAGLAVKNGATVKEIADVLRLVFFTCGVTALIPAADIFTKIPEK
ncbi:MAG: carboxymuconolactone decarboxylase family protein [Acidaminococcaceae bacterium]|jgi:alkylhydroperoxidase/carboxymuconolactone decarboxylase family protein YurZ|nr:carboxymuconolactone decarboxylase family protein [Acidaminococcaceae bacterium]